MEVNLASPFFLVPVTVGIALVLVGLVLRFYPPGEINYLYGYRTNRSMKSQEAWEFAQGYAGRVSIFSGLALSLFSVPGMLLKINEGIGFIIAILLVFVSLGNIFIRTERKLRQKFP